MYAHIAMRRAATGLQGIASVATRFKIPGLAGVAGVILSACSATTLPGAAPHPADPAARVPAASYRSVTSGYTSQRPVEPLPWRERNERVRPQDKGSAQ